MGTLTVRENLTFSANLRLPNSLSQQEKHNRVEETLQELDLTSCADTKVSNILQSSTHREKYQFIPTKTGCFVVLCLDFYAPAVGGIKRYRDSSDCVIVCPYFCPSICPSLGCSTLAACRWPPPEMCGLRTRPRTDVALPRVELASAGGISYRRPEAITGLFLARTERIIYTVSQKKQDT